MTDFFRTGKYDARREFYKTNAPAMDILVSSNLERLVYMMAQDSQKVKSYMDDLNQNGVYEISSDLLEKIQDVFKAGWLNEDERHDLTFGTARAPETWDTSTKDNVLTKLYHRGRYEGKNDMYATYAFRYAELYIMKAELLARTNPSKSSSWAKRV